MTHRLLNNPIALEELRVLAQERFGDMVKADVDVVRDVMIVGGAMHADMEADLITEGSQHENIWGINLYPDRSFDEWVEFDSMINLKASQGNRSRGVESAEVREKILSIVSRYIPRT